MITVGVRVLKAKLREYLRMVRAGEVAVIVDRGNVVSDLRRPDDAEPTPFARLNHLIREGEVRAGRGDVPPGLYVLGQRPVIGARAQQILDELRGER